MVTSSASSLRVDQVDAAIAAIALLLVERAPELLDGAADESRLREWIQHVDTELTPAVGSPPTARWSGSSSGWTTNGSRPAAVTGRCSSALRSLRTLQDELADASGR